MQLSQLVCLGLLHMKNNKKKFSIKYQELIWHMGKFCHLHSTWEVTQAATKLIKITELATNAKKCSCSDSFYVIQSHSQSCPAQSTCPPVSHKGNSKWWPMDSKHQITNAHGWELWSAWVFCSPEQELLLAQPLKNSPLCDLVGKLTSWSPNTCEIKSRKRLIPIFSYHTKFKKNATCTLGSLN